MKSSPAIRKWTAQEVSDATDGEWLSVLPEGWWCSGFCHYAPFFRPEDVLVVRLKEGERGVPLAAARRLKPAAFMAQGPLPDDMFPVIKVRDNVDACWIWDGMPELA